MIPCKVTVLICFCVLIVCSVFHEISGNNEQEAHENIHHLQHKKHKEREHPNHNPLHRSHHLSTFRSNGTNGTSNNQVCSWLCVDDQLLAVIAWLNNTREFQNLYKLLPRPFNITFSNGNGSFVIPFGGNGSYNGSISFSPAHNGSLQFPILSYLARNFADFIANVENVGTLFRPNAEFGIAWREIVASIRTTNALDAFTNNLNILFGSRNGGIIGANFFNPNYWESLVSNITSNGFINTIGQNVISFLNQTGLKI